MAERNLRNQTVSASETEDIERQSHSLNEADEVEAEVGVPNNWGTIAVQKSSTRQEGDMPRNIREFLLDIVSSFKAAVATAVEMLNSNF